MIWPWFSIFGLLFDIIGAGIIARAVWVGKTEYEGAISGLVIADTFTDLSPVTNVLRRAGLVSAWGFGIACVGFLLQLIANLGQVLS